MNDRMCHDNNYVDMTLKKESKNRFLRFTKTGIRKKYYKTLTSQLVPR